MPDDFTFEVSFFERLDKRDPNDQRVMELLAQLYTKVGKNEEGLRVDERLSKLCPENATIHYNLACSQALVGEHASAIDTLNKAISLGYTDFEWMLKDEDLVSLQNNTEFQDLIEQLRKKLGAN